MFINVGGIYLNTDKITHINDGVIFFENGSEVAYDLTFADRLWDTLDRHVNFYQHERVGVKT